MDTRTTSAVPDIEDVSHREVERYNHKPVIDLVVLKSEVLRARALIISFLYLFGTNGKDTVSFATPCSLLTSAILRNLPRSSQTRSRVEVCVWRTWGASTRDFSP
ncbi:hypothetical protein ALC62_00712 [Cyphomyrmex costatus]|uniref:Uncharacterized protein n=1 Tax=Cyphomyrmex costatus TaxID=456900 RepID=A0A151IQ43_9HYME|nr:hypothetical protein ALC62_00712 [Cyphomyrmex costatus]